MRVDIVPGVVPTTSYPTIPASTGSSRSYKNKTRWFLCSVGGYCPKDRRQAEGLLQLHREMEVGIAGSSRLLPIISLTQANIEPEWVRTGRSFPIRDALCKRTRHRRIH
jgi:hypothetical protein